MAFFRGRRNKKSITILLLIVVIAVGGFFFFDNIKKVSAEWYDSNWFYRQAVNITNSGTAQTNYQTSITLNTSTLVTAGKMLSNCNDIRVTDANGKLLPYWIETGTNACNTTTTIIWTKVPSIPTSGQTLYVYYGNPNATSVQNGDNVFLFFDDFSAGTNKWTVDSGSWSISSGAYSGSGSNFFAKTKNYTFTNGIVETRQKTTTGSYYVGLFPRYTNSSNFYGLTVAGSIERDYILKKVSNVTTELTYTAIYTPDNAYHKLKGIFNGTSISFYKDGSLITPQIGSNPTTDFAFSSGNIALGGTGTSQQVDTDWIFTRTYAATEPTTANASEEKGPAPVAYWKFDEGQGITAYDQSSNKNNGTLSGTTKPVWQTGDMCVTGKCLKFDGSTSYVDAGNNASLQITGAITLEGWVKLNSLTTDQFLFGRGHPWGNDNSNSGYVIAFYGSTKRIYFDTYSTTNRDPTYTNVNAITDNNWHHIVATWDGTTNPNGRKIYLDGNLVVQEASTITSFGIPSVDFSMGEDILGGAAIYNLNGSLDDVRVYPYARTAAQIKADYNSRNSTSGTSVQVGNQSSWMTNGLVGYWKMDETSGTLADSSGNSNTGTWHGTGSSHYSSGKFGNGGGFNGTDDYVDAGTNTNLDLTGDMTISAWVKPSSIKSGAQIFDRYSYNSCGYLVNMDSGGAVYLWTYQSGAGQYQASGVLSAGQWTHLVITRQGSSASIYFNGVKQTVSGTSLINPTACGATSAEISNSYGPNTFPGTIDEVRIYNRALSPKEVSDLYNWAPGPVGWWKMDDKVSGNSQTLVDSSGHGNNGTTYYGANATGMNCKVIGKYGGGCLFDGVDDYVNAGNGASLSQFNSLTLEAWIKPTSYTSYGRIVSNQIWGPATWILMDSGTSGDIDFGVSNQTDNRLERITTSAAPLNQWTHIVGTWDGSYMRVYFNGVQQGNALAQTGTISSGNVITIGANSDGSSAFAGSIDDVRIYNYARSPKQIAEDMNAGHPSVGSPVGSYAAYWKFDEGYGNSVYDMSVNTNTGTNHGASWTNDGKFGKTLSFDGVSNYVSLSDSTSLKPTTALTVSAWIKPTDFTCAGADTDCAIFSKYYNYNGYRLFALSSGVLGFSICTPSTCSYAWSSVAPSTGSWSHVVGVWNGSSMQIYINGTPSGSPVAVSTITQDTTAPTIGMASWYSGDYFHGSIDEVKIYPFALTADDVKTEYNQGKSIVMGSLSNTSLLSGGSVASNSASAAYCIPGDTATCNSPVGEWKFDEHTGTSANDTSGNNNNGSLGGGTAGYMPTRQSSASCHSGSCLKFDGINDYVDMGAGLAGKTYPLTFEVWVKPNTLAQNGIIINFDATGTSSDYAFGIYNTGNQILVGIPGYTYGLSGIGTYLTAGQWSHWVAVFADTTHVTFYLNGVAQTLSNINQYYSVDGSKTTIGSRQGVSPDKFFNGYIDDVRIFNYARTPAQIAWDYNRGRPVGWWKFDECQGTTAYDSSGNGNTGAITIGATAPQTTAGTCLTPTDGTGAWYNGKVGKYNSAMSFDGTDDYISVPNFQGTFSQMSIEAWVYMNSYNGYQKIVDFSGDSGGANRIDLQYDAPGFEIELNGGGDGDAHSNSAPAGWVHLVGVWNGTNYIKLYVNGVLANQNSTPPDLSSITLTSGAYHIIGARYGLDSGYFFNGLIDEVKIYNYALTKSQILLDYNQGSAVRFGPSQGRP